MDRTHEEPSRGDPRSVLKDWLHVLAGTAGQQVIGTARAFVVPLLVTPAQYGIWRLVLLLWQYGMYLHCGAFSYLNRELPNLYETGATETARGLRRSALAGALVVTGIASLLVFAWSLFASDGAGEYAWAVRLTALGLLVQTWVVYQATILRSTSQFGLMTRTSLSGGVVTLIAILLLTPSLGVVGLALAMVLGQVAAAVHGARRVGLERPQLRPKEFLQIARSGGSLTVLPVITTLSASVGQVISASGLGLAEAGQYGIGLMIGGTIVTLPRTLSVVLYPRYLVAFTGEQGHESVGALLRRSFWVTSTLTPALTGVAMILVEPLFVYLYPAYAEGLPAVRLLLAASAFEAVGAGVQNAAFALRKQRALLVQRGLGLLLSALLAWAGCVHLGNVAGVALGVAIAQLVTNGVSVRAAFAWSAADASPATRETIGVFAPTLLAVTAAACAASVGDLSHSVVEDAVVLLARLGVVLVVSLFILWKGWLAMSRGRSSAGSWGG